MMFLCNSQIHQNRDVNYGLPFITQAMRLQIIQPKLKWNLMAHTGLPNYLWIHLQKLPQQAVDRYSDLRLARKIPWEKASNMALMRFQIG